jgi:hypothetical protein
MKTLMNIAVECELCYNEVAKVVKDEKIKGTIIKGKKYLDKYQEDLLHVGLVVRGKLTELTLESKMNKKTL